MYVYIYVCIYIDNCLHYFHDNRIINIPFNILHRHILSMEKEVILKSLKPRHREY